MDVTIACCQFDCQLGRTENNKATLERMTEETIKKHGQIILFPECALTGYCIQSEEEAQRLAIDVESTNVFDRLIQLCELNNVYVALGFIERNKNNLYNSAILLGPNKMKLVQRKAHISHVGIDRFVERGSQAFDIIETPFGKLGLYVCYDHNFPESARVLALKGVEVICLITNWTKPAKSIGLALSHVRAFENNVFIACANRIGEERGNHFIGDSHITDTYGQFLACASNDKEEIIMKTINPKLAKQKKTFITDSEYVDIFNDRNPNLYRKILE